MKELKELDYKIEIKEHLIKPKKQEKSIFIKCIYYS